MSVLDALEKLLRIHERRRDKKRTTYSDHQSLTVDLEGSYSLSMSPETLRHHEATIRARAEKHRAHEFDLLGSGPVLVEHGVHCRGVESHRWDSGPRVSADPNGQWLVGRINASNVAAAQRIWRLVDDGYRPIDWQLDFKSGFRWRENVHHRDIRHANRAGVDVKVPWELARMQHLPTLALAFALGRRDADDPNLREFRNQVLDFIATNPPRYGVNWSCAMDVAIRVASWLLAYDLFRGAGATFDAPFGAELTRAVHQHGQHLVSNLEWTEQPRNNHYLSDVVGLLFVAAHLTASAETDTWLAFAVQQVLKEAALQFHEAGSNFEASTSYHRLAAELLAYATALILGLPAHRQRAVRKIEPRRWRFRPALEPTIPLHLVGELLTPLPSWYVQRLARAAELAVDATHPDGMAVQFGDNDSGRGIKLGDDHPLDPRPVVAALDGLFHRDDLSRFTGGARLESECIAGLAREIRLPSTAERPHAYPQFGLYLLGQQGISAWVRCGSVGQNGKGEHAHEDQLSFEVSIDGVRLIVDPGTYLYTPIPQQRNRFRAAHMHSTLTLVGAEHRSFRPGVDSLFSMHDPEPVEVVTYSKTAFCGRRCHPRVDHRRTLRLEGDALHGVDECPLPGRKRIHFHLTPGLRAAVRPGGAGVEIMAPSARCFELSGGPGTWQVNDSAYSAGYGLLERNQLVTLEFIESRCGWQIGRSD